MKSIAVALAAALLSCLPCACAVKTQSNNAPQPSSKVDVANIQASFSAQSDGKTITVYAALLGGAFLELDSGDALSATIGGGPPQTLTEQRDGDTVHYVTTFPQPAAETTIAIAFTRDGKPGAPNSTVKLPPFFTITSPAPPQVSYAGTLPITMTGYTQYFVTVEAVGPCLQADEKTTVPLDPTQHADVPMKNFPLAAGATASCALDVYVRNEIGGTVDPAFKQGGATSYQGVERLTFKTTLVP